MPRTWVVAHSVLLAPIGVPVVAGVVASVVALVRMSHPNLDWSQTINSDAKALALGQSIYADPSEGYAGMLYSPLFPALLAPLFRLVWWDGWAGLVATLAGASLAGLVGLVAATGGGQGRSLAGRVIGGVGVGGTAWWLVSANSEHMLFEGRADHLAWLLALTGLCVVAWDVSRRRTRCWPAVALLSAAVWAKQTTGGAAVAAVVVVAMWARSGLVPWRMWRRLVGSLFVVNAVVGVVLVAVTRGWAWRLMVELPGKHAAQHSAGLVAEELIRHLVLPGVFVLLAGVGVVRSLPRGRDSRSLSVMLATLLLVFLVASLAPTWLARQKQGGDANQWLGMMWAAGLLLAIAHREASRSARAMMYGAVAYGAVLVVAFLPVGQEAMARMAVEPADVGQRARWERLSPDLVTYAGTHSVYLPRYGALGSEAMWPTEAHVVDFLAAGHQPDDLIAAFEARQFDAVAPFALHPWQLEYVALSGLSAAEDLERINEVIARGYAPGANGAPEPLWGRRGEPTVTE